MKRVTGIAGIFLYATTYKSRWNGTKNTWA